MLLTVNGQVVEPEKPSIRPLDRGLLLGDGIFETVRIYSGRAFKLREHLERLQRAATGTEIDIPPQLESLILGEIERAGTSKIHDGYLRITVTRGEGLGLDVTTQRSTVVTMIDALPVLKPEWYSHGIRVITAKGRRNEFATTAGLKTTAYLDSILEFRAGSMADADDAIFLDTQGHLSEATASNLFLVDEGTLYTPPLECGALPGITRATVLEISASLGLPIVSDRALEPERMGSATELFLTSSVREIVPVVRHDGNSIAAGSPGQLTRKIMNAFSEITCCRS